MTLEPLELSLMNRLSTGSCMKYLNFISLIFFLNWTQLSLAAERPSSIIGNGTMVSINGLTVHTDYNGSIGRIVGYSSTRPGYTVYLAQGRRVRVRPQNINILLPPSENHMNSTSNHLHNTPPEESEIDAQNLRPPSLALAIGEEFILFIFRGFSSDSQALKEDRGFSQSELADLKGLRKQTETLQDQNCSICLSKIEKGEMIRVLPCHCKDKFFHATCIETWLLQSSRCPTCRFNLRERK